jgi:hypothetical protein
LELTALILLLTAQHHWVEVEEDQITSTLLPVLLAALAVALLELLALLVDPLGQGAMSAGPVIGILKIKALFITTAVAAEEQGILELRDQPLEALGIMPLVFLRVMRGLVAMVFQTQLLEQQEQEEAEGLLLGILKVTEQNQGVLVEAAQETLV